MPDNEFKQPLAAYGGLRYVSSAVFVTAGGANPTVTLARGIKSIVRQTTGLYRITLAHSAKNLIVITSEQSAAALLTHQARTRAVTPSTGIIDIATVLVSGPTDADTTGITIHVTIWEEQK